MSSATPTKERTPVSDAAASKANPGGITFTEKEERVLKVAWSCLKSGPPEIDIAKLTEAGGFNTAKTAANTWGVIKKKLAEIGAARGDGAATGDVPATPKTPKTPKAKATPKKRTKKSSDDDGDDDDEAGGDDASAKKKRKTPVKKNVKKEDSPVAAVLGASVRGEEMEE